MVIFTIMEVAMNNTVLRGFCQKCHDSIWLTFNGATWVPNHIQSYEQYCDGTKEFIQPVWFLSPAQMKILEVSKEIWNYEGFADMLERNPFLVAKILKETGEDSKEENK